MAMMFINSAQNILPVAYSPLGNNIYGAPRYDPSSLKYTYTLANQK